ncbi:MAG: ABC transporter ATP-binding protein, partial [Sedimenticolaceae bacterium]
DEPLSNLDANLRIRMRSEIRELQRRLGITTIFVTHDQEEANTVADRMAVLNDGILQQVGSPMAMYDDPANRFVARFLGTANLLEGEVQGSGDRQVLRTAGGLDIPLHGAGSSEARATAMFRPQNLSIVDPGGAVDNDQVRFSGRIRHREFLGNLIRYVVDLDGQDVQVDDVHQLGAGSFEVGEVIDLALDPDQVRLLTA